MSEERPDRVQNAEIDEQPSGAGRSGKRGLVVFVVVFAIAVAVVLSIAAGALPPVTGTLAVALVVATLFWLIRNHLPSILLVFVAVLLGGVLTTQRWPKLRPDRAKASDVEPLSRTWAASGHFDPKLPIVVHLLFDEMMSPGAMTDDVPGAAGMRESFEAFAQKHSLRLYESVYSRQFFTGDVIPNLMDAEYRGKTALADMKDEIQTGVRLRDNPYFDEMARRGYRTVVFQTALKDFCANQNVDLCQTFSSFDPAEGGELDARNQRVNLLQTVVRAYQPSYTSDLGQRLLARVYGLQTSEAGVLGVANRFDAQGFPQWFDRFSRFAATVPRGTHVFAHFMVPHSPYLLSDSCVISGRYEGGYYLNKYPEAERAERRRQYYEGYFSQLRCVQRKLDDFLTSLEPLENYRDAVIIIHGDHGSRISSGNVLDDYTERDFIDNYAAFFAVRSPAAAPGVDCEFVSLPEIFHRQIAGGAPRTELPLPVFVKNSAGKKVEARMPLFGCASSATP
jgi:hypothetical protein